MIRRRFSNKRNFSIERLNEISFNLTALLDKVFARLRLAEDKHEYYYAADYVLEEVGHTFLSNLQYIANKIKTENLILTKVVMKIGHVEFFFNYKNDTHKIIYVIDYYNSEAQEIIEWIFDNFGIDEATFIDIFSDLMD